MSSFNGRFLLTRFILNANFKVALIVLLCSVTGHISKLIDSEIALKMGFQANRVTAITCWLQSPSLLFLEGDPVGVYLVAEGFCGEILELRVDQPNQPNPFLPATPFRPICHPIPIRMDPVHF